MEYFSYYILSGSNQGDRLTNLLEAEAQIETHAGSIESRSAIYETAAWGKTNQPAFYNRVICIKTKRSAAEVLRALLSIEKSMGRVRKEKWAERIIDLDILFYEDSIIDEPGLQVPHPHLHERAFVLAPLNELIPGFVHPVFQKTIAELTRDCEDKLRVRRMTSNLK